MFDERSTRRTFGVEPIELVAERMRLLEHATRSFCEDLWIAFVLHAEPPHRDAVHDVGARLELVTPCDVVGGAGREDFDLRVPREMLRDIPRVQFGAAVDRRAVPLDDNGEFHWAPEPAPPSGSPPPPGLSSGPSPSRGSADS